MITIGLCLVVLIVINGGLYYYYYVKYVKNSKESISKETSCQLTSPDFSSKNGRVTKRNKHFEGVRFYEEINGGKRLLVIEGFVDQIDFEKKVVTLKREEATEDIQYSNSDVVYLIINTDTFGREEIAFSDIGVGNFVSYNPVDEIVNRTNASWMVNKRYQ